MYCFCLFLNNWAARRFFTSRFCLFSASAGLPGDPSSSSPSSSNSTSSSPEVRSSSSSAFFFLGARVFLGCARAAAGAEDINFRFF